MPALALFAAVSREIFSLPTSNPFSGFWNFLWNLKQFYGIFGIDMEFVFVRHIDLPPNQDYGLLTHSGELDRTHSLRRFTNSNLAFLYLQN